MRIVENSRGKTSIRGLAMGQQRAVGYRWRKWPRLSHPSNRWQQTRDRESRRFHFGSSTSRYRESSLCASSNLRQGDEGCLMGALNDDWFVEHWQLYLPFVFYRFSPGQNRYRKIQPRLFSSSKHRCQHLFHSTTIHAKFQHLYFTIHTCHASLAAYLLIIRTLNSNFLIFSWQRIIVRQTIWF